MTGRAKHDRIASRLPAVAVAGWVSLVVGLDFDNLGNEPLLTELSHQLAAKQARRSGKRATFQE